MAVHKGQVVGYARVSSADQNLARQRQALGDVDRLFEDTVSGSTRDRPQLAEMLAYVREGDVVRVKSPDRLARSTRDLLDLVCQGPLSSAHRRPVFLPAGGHQNCPLVASWFARLGGGA
ncbi:recombinase family protein, partial [Micrococcus luteus]